MTFQPDIMLVDGRNLLFRNAESHRELFMATEEGVIETGGIHGFLMALVKLYRKHKCPVVVAWEGTSNFRYRLYPAYKAQRKQNRDPVRLRFNSAVNRQEEWLKLILSSAGVNQYTGTGGEADDVLATLTRTFSDAGLKVGIYTGDSDLRQLVSDSVRVYAPIKGETVVYDEKAVFERHQVAPEKLSDLKALAGDASDNIPGAPKIGVKTAVKLINKFGSLDGVIKAIDEDWGELERFKKNISSAIHQLRVYKHLTSLRTLKLKTIPCRRNIMDVKNHLIRLGCVTVLRQENLSNLLGCAEG